MMRDLDRDVDDMGLGIPAGRFGHRRHRPYSDGETRAIAKLRNCPRHVKDDAELNEEGTGRRD